jgi:type II secretion system protein D
VLVATSAVAQVPSLPLPTQPGNPPAVTPATPAAGNAEPTVPLQFLDTDVKDVLALYERWTGRRLIYSTQLVGPIRIFVSGQVPQSEAIKLVEMTLAMNGFYIVPTEDVKIWKVTGVGTNPKQVGIPFVDREDMLPEGEQMVMFLFKLTWADPTDLAATIQSGILVPNQSGASSVVPLPKAQSLLVTETTNIIRTLIRIVRAIDVEPSEVISEFITLQHAQAEDVATNLEKLFEKQQAAGSPLGVPGTPRVQRAVTDPSGNPLPPGVPAAEGNLSLQITGGSSGMGPTEDNIVVGKVRITADKRTNRLHVVSRPVNMKLIRALIHEYDSPSPLEPPAVRPLRFRPVEEVLDAIIAAVKDPGEKSGSGGGAPTTGALGGSQAQRPAGQSAIQNQGFGRNNGSSFGGDGGGGGSSMGETLSTTERDTQSISQQVGKSTIIADKRSNSIIIVGPRDVTEKIFALIDKMDIRQAQVMIHVVIGELRLNKTDDFGVSYILRNGAIKQAASTGTGTGTTVVAPGVGFDDLGRSILNFNSLLAQGGNLSKVAALGSGGLSGFVTLSDNLDIAVKALQATNRFRVVQRPSIFTSNNKRAIITSGEEIPVPAQIQSSVTNTGLNNNNGNIVSNSSIQFKPIELRLEVLPLINSEKEVSLEIVQNISERAGTTRIDNNDIPNVTRRAVKTYVTVPNKGTLILGGLIKESQDNTKGGIPGLVNMPLLGPLFARTTKEKVRNELIIIMRPIVTVAPSESTVLREKTFESFKIPPDLESAIMPQGIREQVNPPQPAYNLRGSAPKLREASSVKRGK